MWQSIGTFYLTKDWQYSNPVQGEIFRVRSSYIGNFNNQYLKGVVASIFVDDDSTINLVESRRLSYRAEPDIFTFYFPVGLGEQRIGVKRLDTTNLDWAVEIEVFHSNQNQDNFANYLISRFGDFMQVFISQKQATEFSTTINNKALTAISFQSEIVDNNATLFVSANPAREQLTIYNRKGMRVLIGTKFEDDILTGIIADLDGVGIANLTIGNTVFRDDLFIQCIDTSVSENNKCVLDVTQFVPVE